MESLDETGSQGISLAAGSLHMTWCSTSVDHKLQFTNPKLRNVLQGVQYILHLFVFQDMHRMP